LLREKIWDYLVDLSQTKKVTVLLTTHYIEEAGQATSIGLMRNGVQIAEDSPQNILQMWETTNLEDAFLKMSERQEAGLPPQRMLNDLEIVETLDSGPSKYTRHRRKSSLKAVQEQKTSKILKALLMKHFLEIVRHFG
jgi:ABC-type multidrug transport system ATPase subunit